MLNIPGVALTVNAVQSRANFSGDIVRGGLNLHWGAPR